MLCDRRQRAPHRVLADDPRHAQQLGQHGITAKSRDVRIALVASEHRQEPGADHVDGLRRVRARVGERAVGAKCVEPAGHLQELDEVRGLCERCHGARRIPRDLHRPRERVERDGPRRSHRLDRSVLTRWVNDGSRKRVGHAFENA